MHLGKKAFLVLIGERLQPLPPVPALLGEAVALRTIKARGGFSWLASGTHAASQEKGSSRLNPRDPRARRYGCSEDPLRAPPVLMPVPRMGVDDC
jgi:hypothetical protein